jgi:predicted transcriptional regulator
MKLSVEDVAKMTGLSVSTVRQYSWRMKVGTKEGTRKLFTREEAKKIGSGTLPAAKRAKTKKAKGKKPKSVKKPAARGKKR